MACGFCSVAEASSSPRGESCGFGIVAAYQDAVYGCNKTQSPSLGCIGADFGRGLTVVGSSDGALTLWSIQPLRNIRLLGGTPAHETAVRAIAVGGDPVEALTGGRDGKIRHWAIESLRRLGQLQGHTGDVLSIAADFERRLCASGGQDGSTKVWHVDSQQLLVSLGQHCDAQVTGVAANFGCQPALVASCCVDGVLNIWKLEVDAQIVDGEKLHTSEETEPSLVIEHSAPCMALVVEFVLGRAIVGCLDGSLIYWSLQPLVSSEATSAGQSHSSRYSKNGQLLGHSDTVRAVDADFSRDLAVSASYDLTIVLWNLHTLTVRSTLRGHSGWVLSLAVSWDTMMAVSGSTDGQLRLWDIQSGEPQSAVLALSAAMDMHEEVLPFH